MKNITIILQERCDLRDPNLNKQLHANGFEVTNYIDSIGAIVGTANFERIAFIEALEGVAWVEKNPE